MCDDQDTTDTDSAPKQVAPDIDDKPIPDDPTDGSQDDYFDLLD